MDETGPEVSAIVPVGQRVGNVPALIDEYAGILRGLGLTFEIIVVLDGPHGRMGEDLSRLEASRDWLRVITLARAFGESAALSTGFAEASGKAIMTLPGYEQVVPAEIARLVEAGRKSDMAIGVRWPRSGSTLARLRRSGFHGLLRLLTGQRYRDLGCGLRFIKRDIVDEIPLYSDRHHFYPVLAASRGFSVEEVEVTQGPNDNYRGPRSIRQYLHRFLDILTLFFLVRFTKKPLRFFGTVGFLIGALGLVFLATLIVQRLFFGVALADRPALLLSSLLLVLGVQVFALGLIGELIIFTHAKELKEYAVRRVIGGEMRSARDHDGPGQALDRES
jgi:glycosyltransferase involved in cell wall biosynthesis